jgi:ketosteroid isomerase-like protein
MKQCPTCRSQYTDDTLQFCLQDGAPLQFVAGSQGAYSEQETVVSGRQSNQINTPPATNPTGWNPNQYSSAAGAQPAGKKSNATFAVFITVFLMLLLFAFVGIGAWLYYRGATPDDNGNIFIAKKRPDSDKMSNTVTTAPDTSKPTPAATVTPLTSSNANTATNTAPVDKEQIRRAVSQRVNSWKSAAESLNIDNYMSHYAGTVDYYNKKGASAATVRADKQRAFTTYSSMTITLSNMSVTPDASGDGATAVFDKEWVFDGAKYSAGKVQTQLKLKKIDGQWLITGERDLKVYYTE